MWPRIRTVAAPRFTPAQIAEMEAARKFRELERDIDRCLAIRAAARPARQEAARKGAQKRRGM